jgi:HemK-related putative methylase
MLCLVLKLDDKIKRIYSPEEDSYLLEEQVFNYINKLRNKNIRVLDMGSGTGIQALACIRAGINKQNILCADINEEAVKHLKFLNLKAIKSDLFNNINKDNKDSKNKFNLIIFNPPYLPENKYDKQADTTAGKKGYEIILKFLKQSKEYLAKEGVVLLLFSSLSKPRVILNYSKKLNYDYKLIAKESVGFFEKLFVYEFSL